MLKILAPLLLCNAVSFAQQVVIIPREQPQQKVPVIQDRELNLGFYFGGGFRKYDGFHGNNAAHYDSRYGIEAGVTYRRTSPGKSFRMVYNLGITYDYFEFEEPQDHGNYKVWHKFAGVELLIRPEFRLFESGRFSAHLGAGVNLNAFFSYYTKYRSETYDPPLLVVKDWDHNGYREEVYFGFNAGLSSEYRLSKKTKIGIDISLISRLRIELTSGSQYTGQNFRLNIVRVF